MKIKINKNSYFKVKRMTLTNEIFCVGFEIQNFSIVLPKKNFMKSTIHYYH